MQVKSQAVAAGGTIVLGQGHYIRLLTCPSPVTIEVRIDGTTIAKFDNVSTGLAWESLDEAGRLRVFTSVLITSQTAQNITFAVGLGRLLYDVATGTVSTTKASGLTTTADVVMAAGALTAILAANAGRRRAFITNLAAGAATLRIGDSVTTNAGGGIPVAPGETITLETTAAISGWNPGGVAQNVAVMEEVD